MDNSTYYKHILDLLQSNQTLWQATIIATDGSSPARAGMKMIIPTTDAVFGNLGGGEMEHRIISFVRESAPDLPQTISFDLSGAAATDLAPTAMICGGSATVFIEPLHMPQKLYIIGAGHCGKALGKLAMLSGFYVHLVDNRPESIAGDISDYGHKATLSDYQDISSAVSFGANCWIVIMTHGHVHDHEVLQQCLRKPNRYLGMIGSKHKVAETFAKLKEQGYSEAELARVHAPIGLKIGSQSPFEIAISIMGEIIRELRLGE
jgi:xanthine dehydrogenase accessory factor